VDAAVDPKTRSVVRATVQDDASPVRRLEMSVDAGSWEDVYPEDGIADARVESYRIEVPAPPQPAPVKGPLPRRLVVLRASDVLGNVATVKVDLP
jgi:hypothetical protein